MPENNLPKNIWTFFIDNYRLTYLIIAALAIFGVLGMVTIPKESAPEIDIPVIVVTTILPGASALDVEELVTNEIETKVQSLADIDTLTSVSSQGFSQVVVNFQSESDGREKLIDVKERVDRALPNLPSDVIDPTVQQISFNDLPILTLALTGPFTTEELHDYADLLADELERINDVAQVNISGAPTEVFEVIINDRALNQYQLTANQVAAAISEANTDLPVGSIQTAGGVYTVRFAGRLATAEDIRQTAITERAGRPILVGEVATVREAHLASGVINRLNLNAGAGSQASISLQVFKTAGEGDILAIADQVLAKVATAKQTYLPTGIESEVIRNDAELIRKDLTNLISSGVFTIVLVLALLVIFLGWAEALIASLVVPFSLFITFICLWPLGYTINFLTLFSLILALGILVDASIVITEGMFVKLNQGRPPRTAAFETIHEFQTPLIAGTLTTVFVFFPMIFTTGIIGKFIRSIPVTVTIVLLAAMYVALAIITTLAVRFFKHRAVVHEHGVAFFRRYIDRFYLWYDEKISQLVTNPLTGRKLLIIITVLFFLSLLLPVVGLVKINMFPASDADSIYVDLENPVGTPLEVTNDQLADLEAVLEGDIRVRSFLATAGSGANAGSLTTGSTNTHLGALTINLAAKRSATSQEIIDEYQTRFEQLVEAEVSVYQEGEGPAQGSPVQVKLKSDDLAELETAANQVAVALAKIPGARNVETGIKDGAGEFRIEVDRAKARTFGISPAQVVGLLHQAVAGDTVTVVKAGGEDADVRLIYEMGVNYSRVGNTPKIGVEDLKALTIQTVKGPVPLATFTKITLGSSRASINHDEGLRSVTVAAGIDPDANAGQIVSQLQEQLPTLALPETVSVSFSGETEDINESFASMARSMLIGVVMILGLLIWQFKSYRQPFFILVTIPLAAIGVLVGLAITRQPLSFPGFIGVVALAGVVVNNAIILIDSINLNRRAGMIIPQAVKIAAKSRLQPIILTTVTTVIGMMPLAFSDPTWAPLAYSVIFGLSFSTVLTLFVVPVLYLKFAERELEQF